MIDCFDHPVLCTTQHFQVCYKDIQCNEFKLLFQLLGNQVLKTRVDLIELILIQIIYTLLT